MLKIIYEGKSYNYEHIGKSQPYDINTEITIIEDASVTDVIKAVVKALQIAAYHIDRKTILDVVNNVFDEIEY